MSTYQHRPWSISIKLILFLLVAACTTQTSPEVSLPSSTETAQETVHTEDLSKTTTTEEELENLLREVLLGDLKEVVFDYEGETGTLFVCWDLQGAFSNDIIAQNAKEDTVEILRVVVESNVEYDQVHISAWHPMTVDINNTLQDTEIISLYYDRATLEERNWDTIRTQYIWWIADRGFVRKELQR